MKTYKHENLSYKSFLTRKFPDLRYIKGAPVRKLYYSNLHYIVKPLRMRLECNQWYLVLEMNTNDVMLLLQLIT